MVIYHNLHHLDQDLLKQILEYRDGNLYWKINPTPFISVGDKAGDINPTNGYERIKILRRSYLKHRLIFLYHHGYLPEFPKVVDHIDGNILNNHIENLRESTKSQNRWNSKVQHNTISGIKGVYWVKKTGKWKAAIEINKKRYYLGEFLDKMEAAKVVQEFREKHHGKYTNHG
jgi:hypothetical protein